MSETATRARFGILPLRPRNAADPHRVASNLELLFDLVFVVAVSFASETLFELEHEGHTGQGVASYLVVFAAIWWAWMSFTWFATSFDTDDWLYRLAALIQMAGALVVAAGVTPMMVDGDISMVVSGYLLIRVVAIAQWIRVAVRNRDYRATAVRYVVGIAVVQTCWVVAATFGAGAVGLWVLLPVLLLELLVPVVAENARPTPWHPHHIVERFGLFTLILLGESVLASTRAVVEGFGDTEHRGELVVVAACGLVIVAAMWWAYFSRRMVARVARGLRHAMVFGYFHYAIFAAAGAVSAGIEMAIAALADGEGDSILGRATLAVPVVAFFLGLWVIALRPTLGTASNAMIVGACAIMGVSVLVPAGPVVVALCAAAIVVVLEVTRARSDADEEGARECQTSASIARARVSSPPSVASSPTPPMT